MPKRFGAIPLPLQLVKQQQFANKIEGMNENITTNTEYLKVFIEKNHEICHRSAKDINKLINSTQSKINKQNMQQNSFRKFLNDLFEIFQCIESQISRTTILINNRKYDNIKKLNQVINDKLSVAGQRIHEFISNVRQYNALDQKYIKKSLYFQDIDKNPVRYYSILKNTQKYSKIKKLEQELQYKLDEITTMKGEIKILMNELANKIRDLYQNIRLKIQQFRKASHIVLLKIVQLIKGFGKIDEVSQQWEQQQKTQICENLSEQAQRRFDRKDNASRLEDKNNEANRRLDMNINIKQQIKQMKKQKSVSFQKNLQFKEFILTFISNFIQIIRATKQQLKQVSLQDQYKKFQVEKAFMVQLLPPCSAQDLDIIIGGHKALLSIYIGIQNIVLKPIFQLLFDRHKNSFTRFVEWIQQIEDYESWSVYENAKEKEKKFNQQKIQWKKEMDGKFKDMVSRLRSQFLKKGYLQISGKASKKSDLFSQKYFQILGMAYFQHNQQLAPFSRSPSIIAYQKIIKSNRLKNILLENEENEINQGSAHQKQQKRRIKSSCCGLFKTVSSIKSKQINEEDRLVEKIKNSKQIDHYTCALKDGYMLYQGVIRIHEDYLRFQSSFNPNTFFGSTDIFIPKFDIFEFIRGRHIMSELITIVTKRGSLQFTSFFVNPFNVLIEIYMSNRNTQHDINTVNMGDNIQSKSQLQILLQKMKKQFVQLATNEKFHITDIRSINTLENEFEIIYQYRDQKYKSSNTNAIKQKQKSGKKSLQQLQSPRPLMFKVTIQHHENSLSYRFWHSQGQNLTRKNLLQLIAKNIINEDRVQKLDNFNKEIKTKLKIEEKKDFSFNLDEQCSIIKSKEKHQFDFGEEDDIPLNMKFDRNSQIKIKRRGTNSSQIDLFGLIDQNESKVSPVNSPSTRCKQEQRYFRSKRQLFQQEYQQKQKQGQDRTQENHNFSAKNTNIRKVGQIRNVINSQKQTKTGIVNKTNSILGKSSPSFSQSQSQCHQINSNASTIKYSKHLKNASLKRVQQKLTEASKQLYLSRDRNREKEKDRMRERQKQKQKQKSVDYKRREEGIKSYLYLLAIAFFLMIFLRILT